MIPNVLLGNLTINADYVLEATWVSVPDEEWGERPMELIRLTPGAEAKEVDVWKFLQEEGIRQRQDQIDGNGSERKQFLQRPFQQII